MEKRPHKIMTPEEYNSLKIEGWHEVLKNCDGFGNVAIRYIIQPKNKKRIRHRIKGK